MINLSLDNIREFATPLDKETVEYFFMHDDNTPLSDEHRDQIFMFKGEVSKFLWDFEHKVLNIEAKAKYFKTITTFDSNGKDDSEIKKYLFNLGIPFDSWVFIAEQPFIGFMLTWKMVIKYFDNFALADYQQIWDRTFNWKLEYNHGLFTFGKDLLSNPNMKGNKTNYSPTKNKEQ